MTANEPLEPEIVNKARQVIAGLRSFRDDMKAQGIHVGMGTPPRCVCCGETWPCDQT